MSQLKRILIMAGGTGGHIFPGLAIAQVMREQGMTIDWLGTKAGLESTLVPAAGIPIHYVSISGLRGKGWKSLLLAPWRLCVAFVQSVRIIASVKPDLVLGLGGFVGGPGGLASWVLRRRLVIHEQNAKAGLTNQWLSHVATKVLEGFPNTFLKRDKVITTGNPVRKEIATVISPDAQEQKNRPLRLLVVGGSRGAAVINALVPQAVSQLSAEERPEIWHQTGESHYAMTVQAYTEAHVKANIEPFITDMAGAYAWADIVLCRAGALTIAELCAAGKGAILVPYPHAVDDHQTKNAAYMVDQGAAVLIQQKELTEEVLLSWIQKLNEPNQRLAMNQAAYQLRQVNVAEKIVKICEEVCH